MAFRPWWPQEARRDGREPGGPGERGDPRDRAGHRRGPGSGRVPGGLHRAGGRDGGPGDRDPAEGGATVHGIVAEMSRSEDVQRMVAETHERFGRLDLLVNNAGITRDGLLIRMKDQDWDDVLTVNLKAVFQATRAAARLMARQRAGRSQRDVHLGGHGDGRPGQLLGSQGRAHRADQLTAGELAHWGILVNAVAPGLVETDMGHGAFHRDPGGLHLAGAPQADRDRGRGRGGPRGSWPARGPATSRAR